jgi:dihydroorotate dehydrogenase
MGMIYRTLIRPLVFRLPPERSHALAVASFRVAPAWRLAGRILAKHDSSLKTSVAGLEFPNPVGIAAGFDKDCVALASLLNVGFGYAVGGTVTLDPRPGNPRPRMLRQSADDALLNALGFPGKGLENAARRLGNISSDHASRTLVSISGAEEDDVLECHRRLEPLVAGVEVNISSPNTAGLAVFQEPARLSGLIKRISSEKKKPLFVKLPRFDEPAELAGLATAAVEAGADGLVTANTLPVEDDRLAMGRGGLSGRPLFESTLRLVAAVRKASPDHIAVIGCGGISSGDQAKTIMDAGANAVQLYTALVYEGPEIAGAICRELLRNHLKTPSPGGRGLG